MKYKIQVISYNSSNQCKLQLIIERIIKKKDITRKNYKERLQNTAQTPIRIQRTQTTKKDNNKETINNQ